MRRIMLLVRRPLPVLLRLKNQNGEGRIITLSKESCDCSGDHKASLFNSTPILISGVHPSTATTTTTTGGGPQYRSQKMSLTSSALRYGTGRNTVELFLDIVCPFSKKQFNTLYDEVFPNIPANIAFVFRCQVQSWHPASTMTHESVLAVSLLQPDKTWEFTRKLFEESDKFYDSHTINEARSATYGRLSKIASSVGVNESKFLDLLKIAPADSPTESGRNGGNGVTDLLKKQIKYSRQNGIHVSPTVCFNGLIDGSISSSFTKKDWEEWFAKNQPSEDNVEHNHSLGIIANLVKGSRLGPKTKKIKINEEARPFDFKRYQTKYVAFKFAYLGWHYNGLVTQETPTELPTVEEEILKALLKTRLIDHPDKCRFSRCGRTDKGVSAMGQVMALEVRSSKLRGADYTDVEGHKELPWLEQLNGCLPRSIRILAYDDTISDDFDARFSCVMRHYKYLITPKLPGLSTLNVQAMNEACSYLVGEHDFRNFCKLDASKQISNFKRTIKSCRIRHLNESSGDLSGFLVLDLEGTAFLWHQVRCITAILLLIGQNMETPALVRELLDVETNPTKPTYEMADDWPLTLYDCDFGENVKWKYPLQPQRLYADTFTTFHESNIKNTITSFLVDAAQRGARGFDVATKSGINLGDGRVKVQSRYVPVMQRRRMEDVAVLNEAWARKKKAKQMSQAHASKLDAASDMDLS